MALSFRAMTQEDIGFAVELEQQSFHDAWNTAMLENELDNRLSSYIIMEKDGLPIGYAGFWLVAGEAQITRVAVLKNERGQGYGKLLTKELLELAWRLEAEAVTLEVRAGNAAAQRAYEANGFKNAGIRPHYYEDNEDAVIMWVYRGQ